MDRPPADEMLHVRLRLPAGYVETAIWLLQEEGWGAALAEETWPAGLLDGEKPPSRPEAELVLIAAVGREEALRRRIEELARACGWGPAAWSMAIERRRREDWESLWRRRWRPFRCAGFVVHAAFHDPASLPLRPGDQPLRIAAGSAFGTGGHASTRMALRSLRRWAERRPLGRVLDLGTGSGILAVAAALLGAERVAGMDPDPASAVQARAAAEANGVEAVCRFWRGGLETAGGVWDTVLANLHSDLIAENAAVLAERTARGGRLFTGGILDRKEATTFSALEECGFRLVQAGGRGRWRCGEWRL